MKKLMIAAAAAAMIAGGYASCKEDPEFDCVTAFKVSFSGKTANEKTEYKTVQKLSAKGYLLIDSEYVTETLEVKVGKEKTTIYLEDGEITKFTYFGKDLEKVLDDNTKKPGKTYKLESDLGVKFEDQTEDYAVNVNQVAFGKVKVYVTKPQTIKGGKCGDDEEIEGCLNIVTPDKFSGWFTGDYTPFCLDEEAYNDCCYEFEGSDIAIFGGTWTAKYDKKNSIAGDCE